MIRGRTNNCGVGLGVVEGAEITGRGAGTQLRNRRFAPLFLIESSTSIHSLACLPNAPPQDTPTQNFEGAQHSLCILGMPVGTILTSQMRTRYGRCLPTVCVESRRSHTHMRATPFPSQALAQTDMQNCQTDVHAYETAAKTSAPKCPTIDTPQRLGGIFK